MAWRFGRKREPGDTPEPSLKEAVIARLTYAYTAEEDHARRRPPYPEPPQVQAWIDTIMAVQTALELPPRGTGPVVARQGSANNPHLGDLAWLAGKRPDVPLLVAAGALSLDEAEEVATAVGGHDARRIRRQVVQCHLDRGDVAAAAEAIRALPEGQVASWRDLGAHHARRGDADAFLALWKQYAAGTERVEMGRLKGALVAGVARVHGWEAGLAACADKRIGPTFRIEAFAPLAETGGVDELFAVLEDLPADVLDEVSRVQLLVRAFSAAAPAAPAADPPRLGELVDRVIALDPTADKALMRARDALLLGLWPAIGEQATLDRVRKAARAPRTRSEIGKVLARDM